MHFFFRTPIAERKRPLQEQLQYLETLQKVEKELEELLQKRQDLPEELKHFENQLEEGKTRLEEKQEALATLEKNHRMKELELETEVERIQKFEAKLFQIKTNKEYHAALKEVEDTRRANATREEEILSFLEGIDQSSRELKEEEKSFKEFASQIEEQKHQIEGILAGLDVIEESVREKQEKIRKELDNGLLKQYQVIKERMAGIAVVPAIKEACQGCNIDIPPQLYNEVLKGDRLIFCPNCQRILVSGEKATNEEALA